MGDQVASFVTISTREFVSSISRKVTIGRRTPNCSPVLLEGLKERSTWLDQGWRKMYTSSTYSELMWCT